MSADNCKTINGEKCIFPFKHAGKAFSICTSSTQREGKFWCATEVDAAKNPTKTGYCSDDCPRKCREYVLDFTRSF